ncbi:hypothetical protein APR51_29690 [Variovorax paradoxus]|nr:hypothetical protein APR52_38170 [Variovorax paradoxus]KPV16663.1 hypothetical protein APR51_29690 [Variovorax paradoxus]
MTKIKHILVDMARPVATGILSLTVSIGLSGCAGFYQRFRDFQNGWRTGEIVEIGRATEIRRSGRTDCRKTASPNELALNRFATLADRSTGQRHAHIVILDPETPLEMGDIVSTNVVKCGTPIRVLSHARAPHG